MFILQLLDVYFQGVYNRSREQHVTAHKVINGISKRIKVGTFYDNFDECVCDIDGMIDFVHKKGYKRIILIGESLGTLKILYYVINNKTVNNIILMSLIDMTLR